MEILANNEKLPFEITKEETLGELISSLLILSNQANKVVLEVIADGKTLPLEEREKFESQPLAEVKRVELRIENKLPIALFALEEAKRLLPEFRGSLSEVAELLMAGQKHKAMSLFGNSLVMWRKIINFVRTVGVSYHINFSEIVFDGKKIEEKNLELLKTLQEIKAAMEREDIVSLSDLIEYELIGKVEEQDQIVNELVKTVKERDKKIQEEIRTKLKTYMSTVTK